MMVRGRALELPTHDPAFWRLVVPAGGLVLVALLVLADQADRGWTHLLLFVSGAWLLGGLLTWVDGGEADAPTVAPPADDERPALAPRVQVPTPLRPAPEQEASGDVAAAS